MLNLSDYNITAERGFLSTFNADEVELPKFLKPVRDLALSLPHIIPTGKVRKHLKALPVFDLTRFCATASYEQQRTAMIHYSFMVQSYVWGEESAPKYLPECLALPIWQLSQSVGQKPLLSYSDYVLDNWALLDKNAPIDLSNIYMLQPFISGQDEAWFVLIHVAIEARAGEILAAIPQIINAVTEDNIDAIKTGLEAISAAWDDINNIFDRMGERCDPYVYFHRVRPWIHGWKDNLALGDGLIYEGVKETNGVPQAFRGQTGSQSSIVPTVDAFLGIDHAGDPLRTYLDELHVYRPPNHRRFIEDVRAHNNLRPYILSTNNQDLTELYNDCIAKLTRFRSKHLEYAASYINKQARGGYGNDPDVGTGGTPFMRYLKKHRDEANAHLVKWQIKEAS